MNSTKNKNSNPEHLKIQKEFERIKKELEEDTLSKEQLFQWYKEEIERRDAIIDKLKLNNEILFNTAMRSNDRDLERMTSHNDKNDDKK